MKEIYINRDNIKKWWENRHPMMKAFLTAVGILVAAGIVFFCIAGIAIYAPVWVWLKIVTIVAIVVGFLTFFLWAELL